MQCWYSTDFSTPATLDCIWQKYLSPATYNQLSQQQKNLLAKTTLGYILHVYKFTDMVKQARQFVPIAELRVLRQGLIADFRTVLSLKLVMLRALAKQLRGDPAQVKQEIKQANKLALDKSSKLRNSDRALFYNLVNMELRQPLEAILINLPNCSIPSVHRVVEDCEELINELHNFIIRFVQRKHRFIMTSQQMQAHDITAELIIKATSAYYHCIPFMTPLHVCNTVKRAIHNEGMNIINYWNKEENSRLRYDEKEGKWTNLVQTYGLLGNNAEMDQAMVRASREIGLNNLIRREQIASLTKYLREADPLVGRVLKLLATEEDNKFTRYVQKITHNKELTDNELIYQTIGRNKYVRLISRFMMIPKSQVKGIMLDMRELLSR